MKACVVIPTIREAEIRECLATWEDQFRDHIIIVVEDNPYKTFKLPDWVLHFSWAEMEADLRDDAWIIPRRTSAVRNYGFLRALRYVPDMIVTLDDDCRPSCSTFLLEHHQLLFDSPCETEPLFDTLALSARASWDDMRARGYPVERARMATGLNVGLWSDVLDLDGVTQIERQNPRGFVQYPVNLQVPVGVLFPMCSMNLAFRPEITVAMYQMPMGQGQPFHRFEDIWCGWIAKKALDGCGYGVRVGSPSVRHIRASDPKRNAELELPGRLHNEKVWRAVMQSTTEEVYEDLDDWLGAIHDALIPLHPYWLQTAKAAHVWRRVVNDLAGTV